MRINVSAVKTIVLAINKSVAYYTNVTFAAPLCNANMAQGQCRRGVDSAATGSCRCCGVMAWLEREHHCSVAVMMPLPLLFEMYTLLIKKNEILQACLLSLENLSLIHI